MSENIPNSFPKFWDHNSILEWGDYIYGIAQAKLSSQSFKIFDEYVDYISFITYLDVDLTKTIEYYRKLLQKFLELYNKDQEDM